jgi:hypothetical protein
MRTKKGFLLGDNVANILLAVLAITVLIILGVEIFGMFSKENQARKAEDNLNLIEEKIDILTGSDYTKDFLYVNIFPPKGWFMINFKKGFFPIKQCIGRFEGCLCLCEEINCRDSELSGGEANLQNICEEIECIGLKACKGMEQEVIMDNSETIKKEFGPSEDPVIISWIYEETIKFPESIEELNILKEDGLIKISKSDRT